MVKRRRSRTCRVREDKAKEVKGGGEELRLHQCLFSAVEVQMIFLETFFGQSLVCGAQAVRVTTSAYVAAKCE